MTVAEEHHLGTGAVGDREECAGGVLVEHPGLVDEEYVTGQESGLGGDRLPWGGVVGPVAVLVP